MYHIKIKPRYVSGTNIRVKYEYIIIDTNSTQEIGSIVFKIVKRKLIIGFLYIKEQYQKQGYGLSVIEYLLSHYKIDCVVGESLYEARTFWNKMIKRFNG